MVCLTVLPVDHHVSVWAKLPTSAKSSGGRCGSRSATAEIAEAHRVLPWLSPDMEPLPSTSNVHRIVGRGGALATGERLSSVEPRYLPAPKA